MMKILKLVKHTFVGFSEDNALKLSASLSYYTLFSLAPMLLIFFSIIGFFYGEDAIRGELYGQINGLVEKEAALQVQKWYKMLNFRGKQVLRELWVW